MERIIGRYTGDDGPLLVVIGGMHGNEPAGVKGVELLLKMLEVEPITNESFEFRGRIVGIRGNIQALKQDQRYIDRDLNRCWSMDVIINSTDESVAEYSEIRDVYRTIQDEIKDYKPESIIVLDLHTTSSMHGIFALPSETEGAMSIAKSLHVPVILGMTEGLQGTSLHFFNEANLGVPTTTVVFESGQHKDPLSVNRAIAGIINCMRSVAMINPKDVQHIHDDILIKFTRPLPRVAKLVHTHVIEPGDDFVMNAGYANFSNISRGEWVACDKSGEIHSPYGGRLLMPLYQAQGEDGFFIIQEIV